MARGTALVILAVALPTLTGCLRLAAKGSARGLVAGLGVVAYLLHVAMLSLSLASVLARALSAEMGKLRSCFTSSRVVRIIAIYVGAVVGQNALAWMRQVVPPVISGGRPEFLDGTGMTTNPVFVQDLAVWLPLMAGAGSWLWRERPWGHLAIRTPPWPPAVRYRCSSVRPWWRCFADRVRTLPRCVDSQVRPPMTSCDRRGLGEEGLGRELARGHWRPAAAVDTRCRRPSARL